MSIAKIGYLLLVISSFGLHAQGYEEDVLNYSINQLNGTPRVQSLGGAFNSLGGDPSAIYINPAGLGFYQRSEIGGSLGAQLLLVKSDVSNLNSVKNTKQNPVTADLNHLDIVFANPVDDASNKWRGGAWGISYQKVKNFNQKFSYEGLNTQNSARDFYLSELEGQVTVEDLETGVANVTNATYTAWLAALVQEIDTANPLTTAYFTLDDGAPVVQKNEVTVSGGINQWNLSYGGNWDDELYVGGGASLVTINYERETKYSEFLTPQNRLLSFTNNETYTVQGDGFNLRLGVIYSPILPLKLSVAWQSPTWYNMSESYLNSVSVNEDTASYSPIESTSGTFSYKLKMPAILRVGVAYFIGKYGFVTADVEYVDYKKAKLKDDFGSFSLANSAILQQYNSILNFKVGAEGRYENYRLRLGYAFFDDPVQNDAIDRKRNYITLGLGYRTKRRSFDLTVKRSSFSSFYSPYVLGGAEPSVTTKSTSIELLAGISIYY
ncbi:MAG: OmpP1/FadL family transporter [Cyclobacteriaceae bacterium]